jgi:hypothetical protein
MCLISRLLGCVAFLSIAMSSAQAELRDRAGALDWQTFRVPNYGTRVEYPATIFVAMWNNLLQPMQFLAFCRRFDTLLRLGLSTKRKAGMESRGDTHQSLTAAAGTMRPPVTTLT